MRVDAHQHFWRYSPEEYPWIQADGPISRDFLPEDIQPLLRNCSLDGTVVVQARQTLEETRWLLELADTSQRILGVVGWVDLRSNEVEAQLAEFAAHQKFVGVRHVVQDEPDPNFMHGADFKRGIGKLGAFGLTYDLLIFPQQLQAAKELVRAFPQQPFVIDHLAKPAIRDGLLSPWREQIRDLAPFPNVMCKLSGLVTEARWKTWKPEDFRPYLEIVFDAFGPDRLMFGSDWPVALLAARYEQVVQLIGDYLNQRYPDGEAKIFGLNATRFYDL